MHSASTAVAHPGSPDSQVPGDAQAVVDGGMDVAPGEGVADAEELEAAVRVGGQRLGLEPRIGAAEAMCRGRGTG